MRIINIAIVVVGAASRWHKSYMLSFVASWLIAIVLTRNTRAGSTKEFAVWVSIMGVNMLCYYVSLAWMKARDSEWLKSFDVAIVALSTIFFYLVGYVFEWRESGFCAEKLSVVIFDAAVNAGLAIYLYRKYSLKGNYLANTAVFFALLSIVLSCCDFFGVRASLMVCASLMLAAHYWRYAVDSTLHKVLACILGALVGIRCLDLFYPAELPSVFAILFAALCVALMARISFKENGGSSLGELRVLLVAAILLVLESAIITVMYLDSSNMHACIIVVVAYASLLHLASRKVEILKCLANFFETAALAIQYLAVPALIVASRVNDDYLVSRYLGWLVLAAAFCASRRSCFKDVPFCLLTIASALAATSYEIWDHIGERFALSIWWGIFAVGCMYAGLVKKAKALRVFGIALAKLFFFDLKHLGTIAKVAVFIMLGVIMLVGTYFYQKASKGKE